MPRKERVYAGQGAAGVTGTKKLQSEIAGILSKEKLEKKVADKQPKRQSVKPSAATKKSVDKRLDKSRSSAQKIRRIQGRAADLRTRAKTAERGGHKRAASAYRQAAQELLQRIPALRKGQ